MNKALKYTLIGGGAFLIASYLGRKKIVSGSKKIVEQGTKIIDYALSLRQESFIKELNKKYQDTFRAFISAVEKLGYDVTITSGYRTFAKQAALKKENSKNASAGTSGHNYGISLDLNLEKDNKYYKKATSKAEWEATGIPRLAKSMGLIWGGDYKNYHDPVHFAVDLDTKVLLSKAYKQFGYNPDKIKGNEVLAGLLT